MEYYKNFDEWNLVKKTLGQKEKKISFYKKELWWCCVGVNVGSEQDGKGRYFIRPVFILKVINSKVFIGLPLTSKVKSSPIHFCFYHNYDFHSALLCQIRIFDSRRLIKKIGICSDYLHEKMKKAVITYLEE